MIRKSSFFFIIDFWRAVASGYCVYHNSTQKRDINDDLQKIIKRDNLQVNIYLSLNVNVFTSSHFKAGKMEELPISLFIYTSHYLKRTDVLPSI